MQRSVRMWLQDIIDACFQIQEYHKNTSFHQLKNNQMAQDAITFNLQIIGEATKQIPSDFREKYTEVPWKDIARLRDLIVHAYFRIDFEIIWSILQDDLPKFLNQIKDIIQQFPMVDD